MSDILGCSHDAPLLAQVKADVEQLMFMEDTHFS
jgi:hypothetical protein